MKKFALPLLLAFSLLTFAQETQTPPPAQGQRPRGEGRQGFARGVGGTIQSLTADTLTLTTRDGGTATVKVTPDTRFMKDGQAAKLSDFKVGDRVMVRGESAGENTWKAEMVGSGRMMMGGGPGGQGQEQRMERLREGLGKEFIAGEVTSIEGTKITVKGPDGKDYVAEVDENTSFKRGQESITFPDIKVGDRVIGRGKLNSAGVFVPETLNVGGFFMDPRERQVPPPRTPPPAPPKN